MFASLAVILAFAATTIPADAKGCIKGAVVGGIAGHYAGRHAARQHEKAMQNPPPDQPH
jgi:hypothetical protein